ncbi:MAG TPA: glycosyltransferase family 2 protein [Nitrosospira sp.]|nr:glycosyltransferase family 2 protein [Nitrosospira sp.]
MDLSLSDAGLAGVSVVVVNHNAGPLLTQCIRACLAQAKQVIVVDNASSDSSLIELEAAFAGEPRLKLVPTGHNLGFARGCNIGTNHATERCILFLNPDCILGAGTLGRMMQVLDTVPGAGMVGGLLINQDGTEQAGGRRAIPTPWRSFIRAFGLHHFSAFSTADFHLHKQPLPKEPLEVEAISGALMLVSRQAVNDVGLWDEEYFLHCEDLDWCERFRLKGWKILFVPDAPVTHYKGTCSRSRPIFVEWHKHKGMLRFYHKFFRDKYPAAVMWLVGFGVWLRFGAVATYHGCRHLGKLVGLKHE